jgi:hypothetical protein
MAQALNVAAHMAAVWGVWSSGWPFTWALGVLGFAIASVCGTRHVLRRLPTALRFEPDVGWLIETETGGRLPVELDPPWITPWLVALTLRPATGACHRLAVWPDMLAPGEHRRLRVDLQWAKAQPPQDVPPLP